MSSWLPDLLHCTKTNQIHSSNTSLLSAVGDQVVRGGSLDLEREAMGNARMPADPRSTKRSKTDWVKTNKIWGGGGGGGDKQGVSWAMRIWWIAVLVERRTFGNLLQQDWFRSLPRYDHRDVVGRPENSIKANDQHISPWNTRAFSTHPIS